MGDAQDVLEDRHKNQEESEKTVRVEIEIREMEQ